MLKLIYNPNVFTCIYLLSIIIIVFLFYFNFYKKNQILSFNRYEQQLSVIYVLFLIFLIGLRPLGIKGFADTSMYMKWFETINFNNIYITKDLGFGYLMYFISLFTSYKAFFLIISFLSIGTLVYVSYKIANNYWFLFFIAYISSLYYWNHNVYSIRQGLASIIFIAALLSHQRFFSWFFMLVAVSFHKALMLPFCAVLIATIYSNTKTYFYFWILSIPISFFSGNYWEILMSKIVIDSRRDYFIVNDSQSFIFFRSGFRWDMIIYSLCIILVGLYNCKNEKIDRFYRHILNVFLIVNSIFILIIQVNHSYRFAYLSWFLSPLIIFYPLFLQNQNFNKKKYIMLQVISLLFLLCYYLTKII